MVYVDAMKPVQAEVILGSDNEVKDRKEYCKESDSNHWFCDHFSTPRVFVGLDGEGKDMEFGLVCDPNSGTGLQKFYSRGYLHEDICFQVSWKSGEILSYYD